MSFDLAALKWGDDSNNLFIDHFWLHSPTFTGAKASTFYKATNMKLFE